MRSAFEKGWDMAARAYWSGQIRLALVSIPFEGAVSLIATHLRLAELSLTRCEFRP